MLDFSQMEIIWVIVGVVLIVSEVIIPGGIVLFLGASCLIVAAALKLGLVTGLVQALSLWFITSIILILVFRRLVQSMVGGNTTKVETDEVLDYYGKTANVLETIGPGDKTGRVSFQDSTWPAIGDGEVIEAGETVTIVCQQNIALLVEKYEEI